MKINMVLILFLVHGCTRSQTSQKKQINSIANECVLLNDSAFKYITRYNFRQNTKDLDTALFLLKRASSCDTSYFIAYSNMANVFDLMKNYESEIEVINKMLVLEKNNWWILTRKGLAYQKLNDVNSAKRIFFSVDSLCQAAMKNDPRNINLIINYITFKNLSDGKNAGVQELDIQIKRHPELKSELINRTNLQ